MILDHSQHPRLGNRRHGGNIAITAGVFNPVL